MRPIIQHVVFLVAVPIALTTMSCLPQQRSITTEMQVRHDEPLRERADRLWNATVAEDWSTVFLFQDPIKRRGMKEAAFVSWCQDEEPFSIHSFRLRDVVTDDELGWVELDYSASLPRFPAVPPRDAHRWQKWRRVEGGWFPVSPQEVGSFPESPALRDAVAEQRLRVRFEESWTARREKDWHRLYELTDPRDRPDVTETDFTEVESLFEYLSHNLHWVEVIDGVGKVRVSYFHKLTDPSLMKMPARRMWIIEKWTVYENEWYRDLK